MRRFILFLVSMGMLLFSGVVFAANENTMDTSLGLKKSETAIYFISDWYCPSCIKLEPTIEKLYPTLAKRAKIFFVDLPIHKESYNYAQYNVQFLVHEKANYIKVRKRLAQLAANTKNPSLQDVKRAVAPVGAKVRNFDTSDVLMVMQMNQKLVNLFGVSMTPTVVITNNRTQRVKKLQGKEIYEGSVLSAIKEVAKK